MKAKLTLALYAFLSCVMRVTAIIVYFAVPLGLFDLLRHLQAEQAPFLFTYNGTNYYDEDPAQYIKDKKIHKSCSQTSFCFSKLITSQIIYLKTFSFAYRC